MRADQKNITWMCMNLLYPSFPPKPALLISLLILDATSHLLFFFVCFWSDKTALHILGTWTNDYFSVTHSLDFSYPSLQNLTSKSKFDSKWELSFLLDCNSRPLSQFESGSLMSLGDIGLTFWSCVGFFLPFVQAAELSREYPSLWQCLHLFL